MRYSAIQWIQWKIIEREKSKLKPAGDPEEVFIRELYHSKAMAFEIFFCIYLMFRKVTVLSLQGGTETGLNREADDRAKTHIGKHFCPGV